MFGQYWTIGYRQKVNIVQAYILYSRWRRADSYFLLDIFSGSGFFLAIDIFISLTHYTLYVHSLMVVIFTQRDNSKSNPRNFLMLSSLN